MVKRGFNLCVPIDKVVIDGATEDTVGIAVDVLYNTQPTLVITAKDIVGYGARLIAEGSADGVEYGLLDIAGGEGELVTHLILDENITYVREIVNASSIRFVRISIVDYTDGTYKVTALAGTSGN